MGHMEITYGHLHSSFTAQLTFDTPDEQSWVDSFLTFQTIVWIKQTRHVQSHKYLNAHSLTIPLGLVPILRRFAAKEGFEVREHDLRDFSRLPPENAVDHSGLRDYQQDAVQKCIDRTYGVISSPVGSGKSHMVVALCERLGCNILVGVHRPHLVRSLGEKFQEMTGEEAGWIMSGGEFNPKRVTFCCFSSVHLHDERTRKYLQQVDCLIVDECHRVASKTIATVAAALPNTLYRFGLSGTPFDRSDMKSIAVMANIGPCIYKVPNEMLIDRGYVAKPVVRMLLHRHVDKAWRSYTQAKRALVVKDAGRLRACVDIAVAMAKPAFCFVKEVNHGRAVAQGASARGVNCVYVDGKASLEQRKKAILSLQRGDIDVIVSTSVFYEGVDVPECAAVANLAAGKSTIEVIQKMGRGTRKANSLDTTFEVWDIADNGKWFADHAKARVKSYLRESADVFVLSSVDDVNPVQIFSEEDLDNE